MEEKRRRRGKGKKGMRTDKKKYSEKERKVSKKGGRMRMDET